MPKGIAYSGEFKQQVVETMRSEKLSYREVAQRFGIPNSFRKILDWERIYLEEGSEGLYIERRGRGNAVTDVKGRPPKLDKQVEEDLIAENQRLRAENDYLKKLNALVLEEERRSKGRK
ncbi:helix-turn-helix domain-containing protein [Intestinimonas butyriciproducens]|uniref:helix-turn-helix domain-containing protein n=1 Tax=Intestinimonas butyriciproducens TaxID=1297617 RepID=UPI00051B561E|nr:helix-turn-helix domain-containing protein [Intestinimonas butyriciproducens]